MLEMINVGLGLDTRENVAYNVAAHSICARASQPVSISPVALSMLHREHTRSTEINQSTEFSFTRFLVPWMSGYKGWSIFMDCDVLVLDDIANLWALRDDRFAVQVVKHDHRPREISKFLGQPQSCYPKKNWSSVMLFNNARCKMLTPEYVNTSTGLELHRFNWLQKDDLIGELPHRWNHLVDYDPPLPVEELSLLHFTNGGPWFTDYKHCGYADLWREEFYAAISPLTV